MLPVYSVVPEKPKKISSMGKNILTILVIGVTVFLTIQAVVYASRPNTNDLLWGSDEDSIVSSNNWFGLSVYTGLRRHNKENVFFSPFSISTALTMTMLGAEGNTFTEMFDTLHFDKRLTRSVVHKGFQSLLREIMSRDKENYLLNLANRMYLQENYKILEKFKDDTGNFYGAEAQNVDFQRNFEGARQIINAWVEGVTETKITELLKPGILTDLTRLVLVNAIYFKGNWLSKFDPDKTKEQNFYVNKDDAVKVDMMFQKESFRHSYDNTLKAQVLELPYVGNDLTLVMVLPFERDGLESVENKLTGDLSQITSNLRNGTIEVTIPKFKLTDEHDLVELLTLMGMKDIFSEEKADLSAITGNRDLSVSHVMHKAHIDVNEEGTEAAAATTVILMARTSRIPQFKADHPFFFFIKHEKTGSILFMGRYMRPPANHTSATAREDL